MCVCVCVCDVEVVEVLIKAGGDVHQAGYDGSTPLSIAAQKGHGEVVEALIKGGCDVHKASNDGTTLLYMAAQKGHGRVVEALLKAGCDTSSLRSISGGHVQGLFVKHHAQDVVHGWRAARLAGRRVSRLYP